MKKQFFIILALILATNVIAQTSIKNIQIEPEASMFPGGNGHETFESIGVNNINVKAVRDFERLNSTAESVKWLKQGETSFVYYTIDNVKSRSAYSSRGRFLHTIRFLNEKLIDTEVRHMVKSRYYDYDILSVVEIENNHGKVLIVKLLSEKFLKTIRVVNFEIDVLEVYNRQ